MSKQEARKPHIALVANSTWNIHNFRLPLIDALMHEGWHISVIAPVDQYIGYKEAYPTVNHYTLTHLVRDSINPISDIRLLVELTSLFKVLKPALVVHFTHKPNLYGAIACRIAGMPSVAVVTGLGYPFLRKGLIRMIVSFLYRLTGKWHRAIIFENQDDRVFFLHKILPNHPNLVSVNGCGVNTRHFQPLPKTGKHAQITFLFSGRLLYDKGIGEYVQAASLLRKSHSNIHCIVVGELDPGNPSTVSQSDLLTWIHEGTIEYLGYVQDVRPVIARADCIVLPSYREAIPRALTEAMAMGRPVIATDTAGCREAVTDGVTGLLVPVGDAFELADAMIRLASMSTEKKEAMGRKGREIAVNRFDDRLVAADMLKIINQVV